jgi:hypothetical protein
MKPWRVSITDFCVGWRYAWSEDVCRAFAPLGWTVSSHGPRSSSTEDDIDYLVLTSSSTPFDPEVLTDVLSQLGVRGGKYEYRDEERRHRHEWETGIDARWWERCTDPRALVEAVPGCFPDAPGLPKNRQRQFWLCASAAGRLCTESFKGRAGPVFDALMLFADGRTTEAELLAARDRHLANDPANPWRCYSDWSPYPYPFDDDRERPTCPFWHRKGPQGFAQSIIGLALHEQRGVPPNAPNGSTGPSPDEFDRRSAVAKAELIALVRDIFGNPYRLVRIDPSWLSWRDGAASTLSQAIYQSLAFDRLPLLADVLEDAGCTDSELLGHLRSPGPHVRGCWAVDLVLGKS